MGIARYIAEKPSNHHTAGRHQNVTTADLRPGGIHLVNLQALAVAIQHDRHTCQDWSGEVDSQSAYTPSRGGRPLVGRQYARQKLGGVVIDTVPVTAAPPPAPAWTPDFSRVK
ncbi:hypothetical protein E6B08_18835 [Pseudomonas putida]|uniref:Uncharacterized protein n=1 Tax=Pseudomonas putida TaxID=303 RepID=A0A4D6X984_PSEPU|nr:hypothetical protein E6B08_18835 [Pseudomonas putida]